MIQGSVVSDFVYRSGDAGAFSSAARSIRFHGNTNYRPSFPEGDAMNCERSELGQSTDTRAVKLAAHGKVRKRGHSCRSGWTAWYLTVEREQPFFNFLENSYENFKFWLAKEDYFTSPRFKPSTKLR